jgi:hypothetical protein
MAAFIGRDCFAFLSGKLAMTVKKQLARYTGDRENKYGKSLFRNKNIPSIRGDINATRVEMAVI